MKLTGQAEWGPTVNRLQIKCDPPCESTFYHRADRWEVRCPDCGNTDSLRRMRAAELLAKGTRL